MGPLHPNILLPVPPTSVSGWLVGGSNYILTGRTMTWIYSF
jgi:hypothetical protein